MKKNYAFLITFLLSLIIQVLRISQIEFVEFANSSTTSLGMYGLLLLAMPVILLLIIVGPVAVISIQIPKIFFPNNIKEHKKHIQLKILYFIILKQSKLQVFRC